MEHYTLALSLRLSKNFNSMEARVEYGRDGKPGEMREKLIADVEAVVTSELNDLTKLLDKTLGGLKK